MYWLVRSAMVALYPRTEAFPGIEDLELDAFLRKFRAESPWLMWVGVLAGALVFHLTPLFTVFVPLPAFLLPRGLRDRHAHRISSTQHYLPRQALFLIKMPAGLLWGADPKVRAHFALPPLPADPGTWRTS
jgi:hypothetical protein